MVQICIERSCLEHRIRKFCWVVSRKKSKQWWVIISVWYCYLMSDKKKSIHWPDEDIWNLNVCYFWWNIAVQLLRQQCANIGKFFCFDVFFSPFRISISADCLCPKCVNWIRQIWGSPIRSCDSWMFCNMLFALLPN